MQLTADSVDVATRLALHAVIHPLQVPLWIDLTSLVVAALAGAAVAVEERFELVGGILLAVTMGLGGGIIRDLLLGLRPVASLRWGLHTPLPHDLIHNLTPKRHQGDDAPQDTAADTPH